MRRREFIAALGGAAAWPLEVRAQQPVLPVVGFLGAPSPAPYARYVAAIHQGLKEAGYIEGQNVRFEFREGPPHFEIVDDRLWRVGRRDEADEAAEVVVKDRAHGESLFALWNCEHSCLTAVNRLPHWHSQRVFRNQGAVVGVVVACC